MTQACLQGAVIQLVAVGLADAVLTGNPLITFWRFKAKPYTNFALERQDLDFTSGQPHFGKSAKCNLDRIGDLVYWMFARISLPGIGLLDSSSLWITGQNRPYYTNAVGQAIIEKTALFIGGQCIDELYSEFLYLWEELSHQPGKHLVEMTGNYINVSALQTASSQPRYLYTPLPFWFTMNSGLALPIVSLQFHSVAVTVKLRPISDLVVITPEAYDAGYRITSVYNRPADTTTTYTTPMVASSPSLLAAGDLDANVEVVYVYLDQRERSKFADGAFEQLIVEHQQTQTSDNQTVTAANTSGTAVNKNFEINFNHAVIELFWVARLAVHGSSTNFAADASQGGVSSSTGCSNWQYNQWFNFSGPAQSTTKLPIDPIQTIALKLNNANRFASTEGRYFRLVQPWQHHTNIPTATMIYSYSFALQPEDVQPSGSANFSRIDNVKFEYTLDGRCFYGHSTTAVPAPYKSYQIAANSTVDLLVFATNWNILNTNWDRVGVQSSASPQCSGRHNQIQGKSLQSSVLNACGDMRVAPGKTWGYSYNRSELGNPEPSFLFSSRNKKKVQRLNGCGGLCYNITKPPKIKSSPSRNGSRASVRFQVLHYTDLTAEHAGAMTPCTNAQESKVYNEGSNMVFGNGFGFNV